MALELSVLSRLASKSFNICGEKTLGIAQEQDPDCPYYKRIPIPPLLDAQIDYLLMEKMKGLSKKVLSELRVMIIDHGRKRWFKIYLTIHVLLVNLESIYQNQCRQKERYKQVVSETSRRCWFKISLKLILDPTTDNNVTILGVLRRKPLGPFLCGMSGPSSLQ